MTSTALIAGDSLVQRGPVTYPSPDAVFDALRFARDKQDWAVVFDCIDPACRNEEVYECFVASLIRPNDSEVGTVLKKYKVDIELINGEFLKRYKELYGVDFDEAETRKANLPVRENGTENSRKILPSTDELFRDVVCSQIGDKRAFFAAIKRACGGGALRSRVERLEQAKFNGETASGVTRVTRYYLNAVEDGKEMRESWVTSATLQFRKVEDGWFLASSLSAIE